MDMSQDGKKKIEIPCFLFLGKDLQTKKKTCFLFDAILVEKYWDICKKIGNNIKKKIQEKKKTGNLFLKNSGFNGIAVEGF